ncbi:MAG TPA: glycosyltransferase [Leeuwenhoekiella sp.]|nr:glycosyltransferase [Leeuwenhoekiella sp.]
MRFLIISHTPHQITQKGLAAYAPYVKEINLWIKHIDEVEVIAPKAKNKLGLPLDYDHKNLIFSPIPAISLVSIFQVIRAILLAPYLFYKICMAMSRADHIHLRCPGNIGLLGCLAQLFFPKNKKTAKYAGNWDPSASQPWSYRLQKYILSHEKLTKNMTVLVYGDWPSLSKNCKSFFTASYSEEKKVKLKQRKYDLPLRFLFVGSLVKGKRPLYALKLVRELIKNEIPSELHVYGDGPLFVEMQRYIQENDLDKFIYLYGNKDFTTIEQAYRKSHFLILPSKSEGWPKVVTEAMWWGVVPVVTRISCVPWMLAEGSRGILIKGNLKKDAKKLNKELSNKIALRTKSHKAQLWSQKYTTEFFEAEVKKLL